MQSKDIVGKWKCKKIKQRPSWLIINFKIQTLNFCRFCSFCKSQIHSAHVQHVKTYYLQIKRLQICFLYVNTLWRKLLTVENINDKVQDRENALSSKQKSNSLPWWRARTIRSGPQVYGTELSVEMWNHSTSFNGSRCQLQKKNHLRKVYW